MVSLYQKTGDSYTIPWDKRGPRVCNILKEMMNECDFVCTVENDMCLNILSELRYNTTKNIKCVYLLKITPLQSSDNGPILQNDFIPTDVPRENKNMSSARKFKKSKQFLMKPEDGESNQNEYYKESFGIEKICKTQKMIKDLKKSYTKTFKDQVLNHSDHKDTNELTNLAGEYAKLYGEVPDGTYESEDGIAIFYDANIYDIGMAKNGKPVLDNDYLKVFISTKEVDVFLPVRFKHRKSNITYDIILEVPNKNMVVYR